MAVPRAAPGWTRAHPFTVSAVPTATRLRITIRATGDGTRALTALLPGARVGNEVLLVTDRGELFGTPGLREYLAPDLPRPDYALLR